ncbi:MAG: allantoicase [Caulobacterales bacterium]|nr:allantoicase [Caulobacterales bacterium]
MTAALASLSPTLSLEEVRRRFVDLAQPRLGSEVVFATDDFFADKARLIAPEEPVFVPGKYDAHGKWMDGWESRRKRSPGHDWCVIRLGVPGTVAGFEIDTSHFTGNYPPGALIEVCASDQALPDDGARWTAVTPRLELRGDDRVYVEVAHAPVVTHVRLNIFPDGGVARLRVWGRVRPDWSGLEPGVAVDLLAMAWGGRGVLANDEHYGRVANLTAPGRGVDMGDGWETRRRRTPGHDWAVLELGALGRIEEIQVDTAHFRGNYPDRCSIQAAASAAGDPVSIAAEAEHWPLLLPPVKLQADHVHTFRDELAALGPVRFVRLNIFPDGGVSRLRMVGVPHTG